jgi:hypothetical protein
LDGADELMQTGGNVREQMGARSVAHVSCVLAVVALGLVSGTPAEASDESEITSAVQRLALIFAGDPRSSATACASEAVVVDDLPPYLWTGHGACEKWSRAFQEFLQHNRITHPVAILTKPWKKLIEADRAYVVVPINFSYTSSGRKAEESGSVLTVVLHKGVQGWQVVSWTMAAH